MGMRIPYEKLSSEALVALIESFILREGTDYGSQEVALETKVEQIHRQLVSGEVQIVFDPESESISIVRPQDLPKEDLTNEEPL